MDPQAWCDFASPIVVMSLFGIVIQATGTGSDVKDNRGQV
jgi:hypothetical protein